MLLLLNSSLEGDESTNADTPKWAKFEPLRVIPKFITFIQPAKPYREGYDEGNFARLASPPTFA
jgi:hypothetical protein